MLIWAFYLCLGLAQGLDLQIYNPGARIWVDMVIADVLQSNFANFTAAYNSRLDSTIDPLFRWRETTLGIVYTLQRDSQLGAGDFSQLGMSQSFLERPNP